LGVEVSRFAYQIKQSSNPVKFLHVANLSPVKDQVTLLKAFQIISSQIPCHLTIIGEGPYESKIKLLADELKVRQKITFRDPLPYENLPAEYHQADILLHTSRSEGHPIVVEEAMSCGVLVCGTRVGLLYDLPDCCIAVPVGDYESLATETLKVISDPERMNVIRQEAYRWASTHSIDWTILKIKACYG